MPTAAAPLTPLAELEALSLRGVRLGLASIGEVVARLDHPEQCGIALLVGGTNGKGSAAATVSAILAEAGIVGGLYTSPHLCQVTERIRIFEREIGEEALGKVLSRVFSAARLPPAVPLTYFEALTAAAFLAFREAGCPVQILEVGLGGRLDATNVADARIAAVTSIGIDHVAELGDTVENIAREKAGVFRAGRPALAVVRLGRARRALAEEAGRIGALFEPIEPEQMATGVETDLSGTRLELKTLRARYHLASPLPGRHQVDNITLAILVAERLSESFPSIDVAAISRGVARTRWPGRIETLRLAGRRFVLDGCHNADGAWALARFLDEVELSGRVDLLFGAMADKAIEEMAAALLPRARRIALATPPGERAAPLGELLSRTGAPPSAILAPSAPEGIGRLLEELGADVLIAGSLYLVGAARAELWRRGAR